MPKISPNYQLPTDPKLNIFDILDQFRDDLFTSQDVSALFDVTTHDACTRLLKLKKWRLVRIVGKSKPMTYEVTPWGKQFLESRFSGEKEGEV